MDHIDGFPYIEACKDVVGKGTQGAGGYRSAKRSRLESTPIAMDR